MPCPPGTVGSVRPAAGAIVEVEAMEPAVARGESLARVGLIDEWR
jgi:hypothetical protein